MPSGVCTEGTNSRDSALYVIDLVRFRMVSRHVINVRAQGQLTLGCLLDGSRSMSN